ncbi:MAG: hypothetical protein RJA70_3775 [Pseudomonadota bacterium]|jgi:hypothetical protein
MRTGLWVAFLVSACGANTEEVATRAGTHAEADAGDSGESSSGRPKVIPNKGGAEQTACETAKRATPTESCGLNGRGSFISGCNDGVLQFSTECTDPDECKDGDRRRGDTACGEARTLLQSCNEGAWADVPEACLQTCTGKLEFDDPIMDRAVREALGLPATGAIPKSAAQQLESLVTETPRPDGSQFPKSLGGVECLIGLKTLGIGVADLTPLALLPTLDYLHLSGVGQTDERTDLSPISHLKSLTGVHVLSTDLSDLKPLSQLTNLVTLIVYYNNIRDFTPLLSLPNLATAELEGNPVDCSDPVQLRALDYLRQVTVSNKAGAQDSLLPGFYSTPCPE